MKLIKTNEKVEVENYPYGFTLKTTLYDSMDFNKHGYRHVTQTINPKTGRLNAPKKSTYSTMMFRYLNEDGHIKTIGFDLNGDESVNKATKFIAEHFDDFTPEEIKYFYVNVYMCSLSSAKASIAYCGAKVEDVKPLYVEFWTNCKKGMTDGLNYFSILILDIEAIDATHIPDYNPFRIVESEPIRIV